MLSFADVVHFFADELAGLRRRRFAGPLVAASALHGCLLRHAVLLKTRVDRNLNAASTQSRRLQSRAAFETGAPLAPLSVLTNQLR